MLRSLATQRLFTASVIALAVAACSDSRPIAAPLASTSGAATLDRANGFGRSDDDDANAVRGTGAVYTETNAAAGNSIIAYRRAADGSLTRIGTFAAGGLGVGGAIDPLTSQYSVLLSDDHDALFAVDAGSNQVSSFKVSAGGELSLASVVSSGGARPISLAAHGHLLYVLNTTDNTLSGFLIAGNARLVPLPFTKRSLAAGANGAAAVRFSPDGRYLVVSERVSNRLEVFRVEPSGRFGDPVVSAAHGGASFGFDITARNQPIVSETQGSVTSYALSPNQTLTPITASISSAGSAACWLILTSNGRYAYTANAGTSGIGGFAVARDGSLTALTPGVATGDAGAGATPLDLDQVGSRFLYTLEAGRGTIGTFVIGANGSLTPRPDTPVGPGSSGLQGIAAY